MNLHIKSALNEDSVEKAYQLLTLEDFDVLTARFPQLKESLLKYSDLRLIVKDMVAYLNKHHMHAWITED